MAVLLMNPVFLRLAAGVLAWVVILFVACMIASRLEDE